MRCNMYDRYVPISSSAQWERAIGRESNEERSAVCGTYVELRRDHSSRCCWHLARGTWRSRSGEWSTHEEAIERLAGSRARESVCRCAPAAVVVFAAHFTRSFVPAPLAAIDARLPAPTHRPPCRANASRPPYATPGHCGSGLGRRDRVDFSLSTHWAGFSLVRDLFGTFGFDGFPTLARHWLADRDAAQYWSARRNFPWRAARGWLALLLFRPCSVAAAPHRIARALPSSSPLPPC